MRKWNLFLLLLLVIVSCSKKDQGPKQPMSVPVAVGKVVQKDVPVQIKAVGTVEAQSSVLLKPQVGGVITNIAFQEGQLVKKGDLLVTIDARPFEAALAQAEANLNKEIAQAKTARELAARYESLVKKDYVTKEQYDQVRTNAEALEASAEADRAAVQNAKLQVNYCTIRSPISGRTGKIMVHAGNVVKANETDIVQIHQIDPIYVRFAVPEENLSDINRYQASKKLSVVAGEKSGQNKATGALTFIDNQVDVNTGTITLKGEFNNPKGILWPGEFVDVTLILTTRPQAIVVPSAAVESGQQGPFVFVVKPDMTAELRTVQVGETIGNDTVVEKGLNPGETVVTDGQLRLLPGAKVEIKNLEKAASS
ncbi:efflux RND transporter periplasmic adaptor subunit [bacterium]|nr:efflux RND transporter periplasmic adaptor subunit [bacterium]